MCGYVEFKGSAKRVTQRHEVMITDLAVMLNSATLPWICLFDLLHVDSARRASK
jgi:hypothetical protein